MAASSISVAATATSAISSSSSSSSNDPLSFFTLHFPNPIKISTQNSNLSINSPPTFFPLSRSPIVFYSSIQSIEPLEEPTFTEEEEEEEGGNEESIASESAEARRLYVGNLPFSITSSQLADVFAEAGPVASAEIVYDRVTDRSRGFAFVTMGSVQEAKEAIRLFDGFQVGGRSVKVNFPEVPRGGEREVMGQKIRSSYQGFVDTPHKIYAGNLSWNLTSQGLRDAFQDQPGYVSAKIIYDRGTGRSRGFGFITFASAEEVESALNAMNGVELEGRPFRLNLSEQKHPLSPRERLPERDTDSEIESESSEVFSGIST